MEEDFSKLRKHLQRGGKRHFLERMDYLYHQNHFFGGWIFCDLWEGYVTKEYAMIFRERIRKATKAFRRHKGE